MVPEDIISIKGQQVELGSKEFVSPVNSSEFLPEELKRQWIDLKQEKDLMFLDSWEVSDSDKEKKVDLTYSTMLGYNYDINKI